MASPPADSSVRAASCAASCAAVHLADRSQLLNDANWAPAGRDESDDEDEIGEEEVRMEVDVHIHNNGPPDETHGDVNGGVFFRVELNLIPEHDVDGDGYGDGMLWDALCMELGINPIFDAGCPPTPPSRRI